jgi:hypothetical protein
MHYLCNLYDRLSGKRLLRLLALLLALAVPAPMLLGDDHDRNNDREHGRFVDPIVGSWTVEVTVGSGSFTNLGTFTEDGADINSDGNGGTGHGLWIKTAPGKYMLKFLTIDAAGTITTIRGTLNLQGNGQLSGPFQGSDTKGASFDGTAKLTRITFDSTP